jgi:hypothetical protein
MKPRRSSAASRPLRWLTRRQARKNIGMNIHFGKLSWKQEETPIEEGWNRIQSPGLRLGYGLAIVIGLVVIFLLFF